MTPSSDVVVGAELSSTDAAWKEAAAELVPAKSLDRIETNGRLLLGSTATVTALLTGLGLFTVNPLTQYTWTLLPTISCASISLALAAWSLAPRGRRVQLGDLNDVQDFYESEIRFRGWLIRWAGILFGAALFSRSSPPSR